MTKRAVVPPTRIPVSGTRLLCIGLLILAACARPAAAAGCSHLLVDPVNDVQETGVNPPTPAEDTRRVDIRTLDLSSNGKNLMAVLGVQKLDPETASIESHSYSMGFDLDGERFYFDAFIDGADQRFYVSTQPSSDPPPEDANPPQANHKTIIADADGSLSSTHRTITVWAPLEVFGLGARSRAVLSGVRATTGAGVTEPLGGAYLPADTGRTDRAYRTGARSCI